MPPSPALSERAASARDALESTCARTGGEGAVRSRWASEGAPATDAASRLWRPVAFLLVGVAAVAGMTVWAGARDVARALEVAGWALVPLAAAHIVSLSLDAAAWWRLAPPPRPGLPVFLVARWIREGVNALLPAAQIGGEAAAVRVLAGRGGGAGWHGAVVALDLAAEFASMVVFGAVAAAVLLGEVGPDQRGEAVAVAAAMVPPALLALALLAAPALGLLERSAPRLEGRWPALAGGLREAATAARAVRARPTGMLACLGLHGLGWMSGAAETWVLLIVLGHPVPPQRAFALEGTTEVLRAFGFLVPGMLGVQEGSLIAVGGLLGLAPADAVALSLFRRARDVALGLPALGAWWLRSRRGWRADGGSGPDDAVEASSPRADGERDEHG